jgi:hypothetical protein
MCSLLATAINVGREVVGMLSDSDNQSTSVARAGQLSEFNARLDQVLQPEKAEFNKFLTNKQIGSIEELSGIVDQLKQTILSDGEMADFLSANGGFEGSFTIDMQGDNFVIQGASGSSYSVPFNSSIRDFVAQLYQAQSVLNASQQNPGMSLSQAVDLAFAGNSGSTLANNPVTVP